MPITKQPKLRRASRRSSIGRFSYPEGIRVRTEEGEIVVLSARDYENLIETMRVLADPVAMKSIEDTRRKVARGEKAGISFEEAFSDLLGARN